MICDTISVQRCFEARQCVPVIFEDAIYAETLFTGTRLYRCEVKNEILDIIFSEPKRNESKKRLSVVISN